MEHQHKKTEQRRFSDYFYNPITYLGLGLALLMLLCELLLFGIDFFSHGSNVYLGIFTYILLPPFFIIGLLLIPIGARWKQRRVKLGIDQKHPHIIKIDPTLASHQNALAVFAVGTVIVLVMTTVGSYKAFHYMESVQFCGTACHNIMKPEYTTYLASPHARVKCVDCHIGEGADSYLKSKLSGARMVMNTFNGSYSKPVPTPVHNLRPASETCERCHWPGKSFNAIEVNRSYFSGEAGDDGKAKRWDLKMLMLVGDKDRGVAGVHAHMYNNNDIYYVADDVKRQTISWVKSVSKSGEVQVFTTENSPYKTNPPSEDKIRKMDCMDCHNRPAHHFLSPGQIMNQALVEGKLDSSIPNIKDKGEGVLGGKYATQEEAVASIKEKLEKYYKTKKAEYYATHQKQVDEAIDQIIGLYQANFFPEMKSRWDAYPDNIGHMLSSGCFRCHDQQHKSNEGKVISQDCTICHTITAQGSGETKEKNLDGVPFQHPFEDDGSWKESSCTECHSSSK